MPLCDKEPLPMRSHAGRSDHAEPISVMDTSVAAEMAERYGAEMASP